MSEMKAKKIPYGISDYVLIRQEDYYYVDKTRYLGPIEQAGRYLFFIRPRRFGKSLFLSLMECYFDVLYEDRFDELFNGTWIHQNPTDQKNKYLVLKFNFSAVDPRYLESSFVKNVRSKVKYFLFKYADYLDGTQSKTLINQLPDIQSAPDILGQVVDLCKFSHQKIYIIIDEYDNFANTILSTSGSNAYHDLTHGEGFFRAFFNFLKEGTTGSDAPISRLFITGVSPVTLDDVTSGFNIGDNISLDADLNHTLGFTRTDVETMIAHYQSAGMIHHPSDYLLEIMERWYGNYLFSKYARQQERLFNSDMVLYFLKQYFKIQTVPDDMIDRNVRIDYGKLRHLIIIDKDNTKATNGNFSQLKDIIENSGASASIVKGFPLEKLTDPAHFKSLLFYFGLLTIEDIEKDKLRMIIPNETVRRFLTTTYAQVA